MNTKIGYISDCHLEFAKRSFYIPEGLDILILAGDTHRSPTDAQKVIKELREQTISPIIYICGNHEFYGRTFPNGYKKYKKLLERIPNVYMLEKEVVVIENIRILGTTLWSDLSNPINDFNAKLMMNDYRLIKNPEHNTKSIIPFDTTKAFLENKNWIISILKQNFNGYTIVVTHHVPSFKLIDLKYKNNPTTPAFASNLDNLLIDFVPDVWIYGHSHSGLNMKIGETEVLTNPIGYPDENNNNNLMKFREISFVKKNSAKK